MIFELAAFNPEAVKIAHELNVKRVEYCSDYALGGITPPEQDFVRARNNYDGELLVMIRPRGGDFICHENELSVMIERIDFFNNAGADGFVFGCLLQDGRVDIPSLDALVKACGNKPATFHRAIDHTPDYFSSLHVLVHSGVRRVLTSGNSGSAMEGKEVLKEAIHQFGQKIEIVAGGGIRSGNLRSLIDFTKVTSVHSAAITGKDELPDPEEIRKLLSGIQTISY